MSIQRTLQWLLLVAATAAVLFFTGYMFFKQSTRDIGATAFLVFLTGIALSPIVIWWALTFRLKSAWGRYAWLIGAAVLFSSTFVIYYHVLVTHYDDALNGLALFFLPLYQDAVLALLFGVIYFIEWLRHRHDTA
jgi:hypothetical protein